MVEKKEKQNAYEFHGLDVIRRDDELITDCIFCNKEQHFYVNAATNQYDCKTCNAEGNLYTFLKQLIAISQEETTLKSYKAFAKDRGISVTTLKRFKVAQSPFNESVWYVPMYSDKNKLVNVYRYDPTQSPKFKMVSTPYCNQYIINIQHLSTDATKPLWLVEGHWDVMAMDQLTRSIGMREEIDLIGAPGARTFKKEWIEYLFSRDVYIVFDNDYPIKTRSGFQQAGLDGMKRINRLCNQATQKPNSFNTINWPEATPDGCDIRDLLAMELPTNG